MMYLFLLVGSIIATVADNDCEGAVFGEWGDCSASCGEGYQTRSGEIAGKWIPQKKCPSGHLSNSKFLDSKPMAIMDAINQCAAGCDARAECKFGDLAYISGAATCYLKGDACGDYMNNGHWAYRLYVKGSTCEETRACKVADCPATEAEWMCKFKEGCDWANYKDGIDFGYYSYTDGDCTRCQAQCDSDPKCWAIECDLGYCSWWRTGVCKEEDNDDKEFGEFFTCRNPAGVIDSLAKLQEWCSLNASNCMTCRGDYDGSTCTTNPKVLAKCRKFKGNDVCDRIVGCRSVTNRKGKTKCKGNKHGLK